MQYANDVASAAHVQVNDPPWHHHPAVLAPHGRQSMLSGYMIVDMRTCYPLTSCLLPPGAAR